MSFKREWISVLLLICVLLTGYPLILEGALVGPFTADTAETTEPQKFVLQVNSFLFIKQGIFDEEGKRQALSGNDRWWQLNTIITPVYGLFNNFELSLDLPVQYTWVTLGDRSSNSGGLGDILLSGKYRLLENDKTGFKPSLALTAKVKFPTGKYEGLSEAKLGSDRTGTGSYEYMIGLNVSKFLENWAFHFNLLYDWGSEATIDGVRIKPGNLWNYNLAAEYSFSNNFSFLLEMVGVEQGKVEEEGRGLERSESRSLSLVPALGWQINEKALLLMGCSFSLLGKNTDYGLAPTLVFSYSF